MELLQQSKEGSNLNTNALQYGATLNAKKTQRVIKSGYVMVLFSKKAVVRRTCVIIVDASLLCVRS